MTAEETPLLVEREGPIMILTLNRPERLNALNRPLQRALERAFAEADSDPGIRVIVITGAGRGFCSGADVERLSTETIKPVAEQRAAIPNFTARQAKVFKPTICAVNGVCAGAGLHFVADSDIVIASEDASFVDTHVNVGQVSALEPIGLLRKMSQTDVLRMVVLGKAERIGAARAAELRMISEVVPKDRLLARALELAHIAAAASPAAVKASLEAIWGSYELPLAQAYEVGLDAIFRHRSHPDSLEGTRAFIEKREPIWSPDG